jgi:hypothetical protein
MLMTWFRRQIDAFLERIVQATAKHLAKRIHYGVQYNMDNMPRSPVIEELTAQALRMEMGMNVVRAVELAAERLADRVTKDDLINLAYKKWDPDFDEILDNVVGRAVRQIQDEDVVVEACVAAWFEDVEEDEIRDKIIDKLITKLAGREVRR